MASAAHLSALLPRSQLPFTHPRSIQVCQTCNRYSCRPNTPRKSRPRHVAHVGPALLAPLSTSYVSSWQVWSGILAGGAIGIWSEDTRIGRELSGALVSTLVGLILSNLGLLPFTAPAYDAVNKFLLPLAIPLILFSADLKKVIRDTGKLLVGFLIGSVATALGTIAALAVFPLRGIEDGWKVASALCGRHIGGAVNFVGVGEALGLSSSTAMAALAADNLLCVFYFAALYYLARGIGPENSQAEGTVSTKSESGRFKDIDVRIASVGLTLSAGICFVGSYLANLLHLPGAVIPIVTGITVILATAFPKDLQPLIPSSEGIAIILMHVFFCVIGATGSLKAVISQAPVLFCFSLMQISVHLLIIFGVGRLAGIDQKSLIIASNANVGGPTTAAGMCTTKGWKSSIVPGVLIGTFGYAAATFVAITLGYGVLKKM